MGSTATATERSERPPTAGLSAFRHELAQRAADLPTETSGEKRAVAVAAVTMCHTGDVPAQVALDLAERAAPSAAMTPHVEESDETASAVGFVRIVCDAPGPSIFETSLGDAESAESVLFAARMQRSCAIVALRRGELIRAEAHARASWKILGSRRSASEPLHWWSAAVLVDVLIERGHLDEAADLVHSTGFGESPLEQVIFPWPPVLRGRLALVQGDTPAGAEILLAAGAWLEQRGFTNPSYIPWRALAAPAVAATDGARAARAVIAPAVIRARHFGAPWALGMALRAAGVVEGGERGIDMLRDASAVLTRSPCRLEHARTLVALGSALRRLNRRVEAREHLRPAREMAHRCGATPSPTTPRGSLPPPGLAPAASC